MIICYNFASRSRPEKFFAAIDNIIENATHEDYFILAVLDEDDETMSNQAVRDRIFAYGDKVFPTWGVSNSKVHAINREIGQPYIPHWDIVCNHSDDMWWTEKGFDQHIINAFDGFSGLLHIPDGHANSLLCTYSIMDRAYFELTGYIYNPSYWSLACDNEAHEVAVILERYKYVAIQCLLHKHSIWGYGPADALLKKTESFYAVDVATFTKRKSNNFGLLKNN